MVMNSNFLAELCGQLADIDAAGLEKRERVLHSRQGATITVERRAGKPETVLNFCANDYLGLAADPRVIRAGQDAAEKWGSGMASVRFICGTQAIHKELEAAIAGYLGFEDAMLFAACFDANGALFEPLLGDQDAVVSDSLNHASIIDGIRLSKARRYRFASRNMNDLEAQLQRARGDGAKTIVIATDGVFSMDGYVADLPSITALAERYEALVMVDDCHATGHIGPLGMGSGALHNVGHKIDIVTGTFGKTLGGSMGGFICAKRELVALLRQRARPYLFSNSLAPAICGSSLEAIRIARSPEGQDLRQSLHGNHTLFRAGMRAAGFDVEGQDTPIAPVMLGDARIAQQMADFLLDSGIYVTSFSYPVVPQGKARIRVQLSAVHRRQHVLQAIDAFISVRDDLRGKGAT